LFFPQLIKAVNDIETFDKEKVILIEPPEKMLDLKKLVLEKLVESNGIIQI
jgi:hypothetical protein